MIVTLQGGLGNQMFQYAFGISVASQRQEELFFTRYRVDEDFKRSYSLGAFNCNLEFVPKESAPCFSEDVFQYNPLVYTYPKGCSFSGHWQTEKYFIPELVRRDFTLKNTLSAKSQLIAEEISKAGSNSAFLHIRRGDYMWATNQKFHGVPSSDYYKTAIALIQEKTINTKFLVFSDDANWCRKVYPNFIIVDHNKAGDAAGPGQEHEDLYLMSLCRHAVIANSSFSWWGAWLGDTQEDRLVFAPKDWFVTKSLASKDIVPDRWIKIDN